jgi:hypothetical protein
VRYTDPDGRIKESETQIKRGGRYWGGSWVEMPSGYRLRQNERIAIYNSISALKELKVKLGLILADEQTDLTHANANLKSTIKDKFTTFEEIPLLIIETIDAIIEASGGSAQPAAEALAHAGAICEELLSLYNTKEEEASDVVSFKSMLDKTQELIDALNKQLDEQDRLDKEYRRFYEDKE